MSAPEAGSNDRFRLRTGGADPDQSGVVSVSNTGDDGSSSSTEFSTIDARASAPSAAKAASEVPDAPPAPPAPAPPVPPPEAGEPGALPPLGTRSEGAIVPEGSAGTDVVSEPVGDVVDSA